MKRVWRYKRGQGKHSQRFDGKMITFANPASDNQSDHVVCAAEILGTFISRFEDMGPEFPGADVDEPYRALPSPDGKPQRFIVVDQTGLQVSENSEQLDYVAASRRARELSEQHRAAEALRRTGLPTLRIERRGTDGFDVFRTDSGDQLNDAPLTLAEAEEMAGTTFQDEADEHDSASA